MSLLDAYREVPARHWCPPMPGWEWWGTRAVTAEQSEAYSRALAARQPCSPGCALHNVNG